MRSVEGAARGQKRPGRRLLKIGVALGVLGIVAWLFVASLRQTNAAPYSVRATGLSGWTLVAGDVEPGVVALVPPSTFSGDLFRQVFQRTMQSLVMPARPSIPLVLRGEYAQSLQRVLSVDNIMEVARRVGVHEARFKPVCLGTRQESSRDRSRQMFFVLFETPIFDEFRRQLASARQERTGGTTFDPAALQPILVFAGTDGDFVRWWPITVGKERRDCEAPAVVTD